MTMLTVTVGASGNLPQHQAKGPDVHSLIGVKAVHLNRLVQHLWGHVALGAHFGVVSYVKLIVCLCVSDCQTWKEESEGGGKKKKIKPSRSY